MVWLKDLQSNWLSWTAVTVTLMISAASCGLALSILVADGEAAGPVGGTLLGMAVCAIVLITLGQMRLIIEEHHNVYQSWRMIGMPGWLIIALVLAQVLAVSLGASIVGVQLIRPLLQPAAEALRGDDIPIPDLVFSNQVVVFAVLVCVISAIVGSALPLRRIFRLHHRTHPIWVALRFLIAVAAVVGCGVGGAYIKEPGDILGWAMGIVVLVALLLPWLMTVLDQWTRVLGLVGPGIAGANVRVRRKFSTPHIVPWVLFGGLIVGVGSGLRILAASEPGSTLSSWQVFVVMLGPVVAPSVVGATMTSLIMHGRIGNDIRGLRCAGAPLKAWSQIQIGEAAALTGTAALVVGALTALVVGTLNYRLSGTVSLDGFWWPAFAALVGAMFLALCGIKLAVAIRAAKTTR